VLELTEGDFEYRDVLGEARTGTAKTPRARPCGNWRLVVRAAGVSERIGTSSITGATSRTSQFDRLSSTMAMIVLFWSRQTRDLLKSFGCGTRALHR
jgi:hypothetical protein